MLFFHTSNFLLAFSYILLTKIITISFLIFSVLTEFYEKHNNDNVFMK
jgi:hypothetical protein